MSRSATAGETRRGATAPLFLCIFDLTELYNRLYTELQTLFRRYTMPVSLQQTADIARFDISFYADANGPVEGYVTQVGVDDQFSYMPFNLDGQALADVPFSNPVDAAILCISDYVAREVAHTDNQIRALEDSRATATGIMLRAIPRRIANMVDYRATILGES